MMFTMPFVVVLVIFLRIIQASKACPGGYVLHSPNCYRVIKTSVDFFEAQAACVRDGGTLANPGSLHEHDVIASLLSDSAMIGINDLDAEGTWVYMDGTMVGNFSRWSPVPNTDSKDCVSMRMDLDFRWTPHHCNPAAEGKAQLPSFVCQIEPYYRYNDNPDDKASYYTFHDSPDNSISYYAPDNKEPYFSYHGLNNNQNDPKPNHCAQNNNLDDNPGYTEPYFRCNDNNSDDQTNNESYHSFDNEQSDDIYHGFNNNTEDNTEPFYTFDDRPNNTNYSIDNATDNSIRNYAHNSIDNPTDNSIRNYGTNHLKYKSKDNNAHNCSEYAEDK
ncbi:COLEC11 [Branchiostoma lanceolatum]|uniref:COLEC11 protein n=1 Tax=Branchiostoma lanceolatum TaxID=7740 RepID=A0A8K0EQ54_BRALA|nr:COLEC11 [Branchiostoma lanceolatum]